MTFASKNRLATVAMLFLFAGVGEAAAQSRVVAEKRYAQVAAELQELIQHELREKELPGFSIALVDDQQIVWAQGFGFADPDKKTAATAETVYRVGSVSKLYTSIGIMQQVERGRLNLDAPVSQYLPNFRPENPFQTPITLRELMSHRAGLVREPPIGSYFDNTQPALSEVVKSLNSTELVYEPGTHTKYSNAGNTVAGFVLESITKQPYAKYLQESVLQPLGLNESSFLPAPALTARLAKGYMWTYDGRVFPAPTFELGTGPAGNMYSTVMDQARFLSWLFTGGRGAGGEVLKPEMLQQMLTPQGPNSGYGLGFALLNIGGIKMVGHRGGVYGFSTELLAMPESKLGVVAITNMDNCTEVVWHVAFTALRLMMAARANQPLPPLPLTTKIPAQDMNRLPGHYAQGPKSIDIFEREGRLFIEPLQVGARNELRQLGDSLVTDDRNGWGWRLTQVENGVSMNGNSEEIYQRAAAVKPPQAPPDWHNFFGEYGWDYNVLQITNRNNELTALLEMEFSPLIRISDDVWEFPTDSAYDHEKLTFIRDKNGCASRVKVGEVVFPRRSPCIYPSHAIPPAQ